MDRLLLLPEENGYSYKPATQTQRTQHEGPAGRHGLTIPNATARVSCTWLLTPAEVAEFTDFYNKHALLAEPFLVELLTKRNELRDCIAYFDPETFSFSAQSGLSFSVTVELQVLEA